MSSISKIELIIHQARVEHMKNNIADSLLSYTKAMNLIDEMLEQNITEEESRILKTYMNNILEEFDVLSNKYSHITISREDQMRVLDSDNPSSIPYQSSHINTQNQIPVYAYGNPTRDYQQQIPYRSLNISQDPHQPHVAYNASCDNALKHKHKHNNLQSVPVAIPHNREEPLHAIPQAIPQHNYHPQANPHYSNAPRVPQQPIYPQQNSLHHPVPQQTNYAQSGPYSGHPRPNIPHHPAAYHGMELSQTIPIPSQEVKYPQQVPYQKVNPQQIPETIPQQTYPQQTIPTAVPTNDPEVNNSIPVATPIKKENSPSVREPSRFEKDLYNTWNQGVENIKEFMKEPHVSLYL